MRFVILLAFFFVIASQPVFSLSLEALVGVERAATLRAASGSTPTITEVQFRNPGPRLVPSHGELRRLVNETMGDLNPNLFTETLYLYKKPSTHIEEGTWNDTERALLFNQMVALSTLSGIQYYSTSRNAMRTFYEQSQVVDGPTGRNPLPDPVFTTPPVSLTLYARQKDLTFGDNIYRFNYHTSADALLFVQENTTSMSVGIIPAVGKNQLRTVIAVIDAGDSLLIYAAVMARAVSLPGMGERISASFTNRVEAILKWFSGQADGVFGE